MSLVPCAGCGALLPDVEGPTHRYMESSPACWATFGEVLAREYEDPEYARVHRLTVDTYAVQHPGRPSPQSVQSVALHLIGLCLVFERGWVGDRVTDAVQAASAWKDRFHWLTPPPSRGALTIADVERAAGAGEHAERVREWASGAWLAWSSHHAVIRGWLESAGIQR